MFESIWKIQRIVNFIKHFDSFIERSAYFFQMQHFLWKFYIRFICPPVSYIRHAAAKNTKLIERIERMSKLIDLIITLATLSSIVSPVLVASINYLILGMGNESFRFDGTLWLPFKTNQPIGFMAAAVFQCMSVFAVLSFSKSIICIFIGSCWSIVTFLEDIAKDISHLKKKKIAHSHEQELTERIRNFIRFHTDVEELSIGYWKCCKSQSLRMHFVMFQIAGRVQWHLWVYHFFHFFIWIVNGCELPHNISIS